MYMSADVKSAFEVAFWFADAALAENEYMQPQKLHRLLFIAQAYYSVAYPERKLMPAVFVADELGPVEPNVYTAFSRGRPIVDVDEEALPHDVVMFLSGIWRRFGHYSIERLTGVTNGTHAYKEAFARAARTEITIESMCASFTRDETVPAVDKVIPPRVMRTQSGKPVVVKSWNPVAKPAK